MEHDSQLGPIPDPTRSLVSGDRSRHHLRSGVGVEALEEGRSHSKWARLEKAAFGS